MTRHCQMATIRAVKTSEHRRGWPDKDTGPWEIVLSFARQADGSEPCVGFTIQWLDRPRTRTRPDEVSSTLVRRIRIGSMIAERQRLLAKSVARKEHVERWARSRRRGEHLASLAPTSEAVEAVRRQLEGRRGKPGRPPTRSAKFHARVARIYSDAYVRGQNPTQAVANAIPLTRSGAGKAVYRARKLGLLGPAPAKGKAGGLVGIPGGQTQSRKTKETK